jgi:anhydro-N-acetylmuramic acid kinase
MYDILVTVPERKIVDFKEAIIMALIGVLRWREEETVFSSVTGSSRNSIGGALWMGAN